MDKTAENTDVVGGPWTAAFSGHSAFRSSPISRSQTRGDFRMKWPRCLTIPRKPDFVIGEEGDAYLHRWWIVPRNRLFNIYLHHFLRSDDDRALHDHPWWNVSILLSGCYLEVMPTKSRMRIPFVPVGRRATASHCVTLVNGPVWTLFITGPVIREWGFHCPQGWRPWREFVSVRDGGNARGAGCE